jgi:hypothetical protein
MSTPAITLIEAGSPAENLTGARPVIVARHHDGHSYLARRTSDGRLFFIHRRGMIEPNKVAASELARVL